jgi:hypothetical protein
MVLSFSIDLFQLTAVAAADVAAAPPPFSSSSSYIGPIKDTKYIYIYIIYDD